MEKTKVMLSLGSVCLIALVLQSTISVISILIPYLTFCACSFIVCEKKREISNIFKIILFGLLGLPIFDFVFSMFTASLSSNLLSSVVVIALQNCIYFAAFVFVNAWINQKKNILQPKIYAVLFPLILVYSLLEGVNTLAFVNYMNQAIEQGNIFSLLSAIDGNSIFSVISKFAFYLGVFYSSIQFSKKH